MTVHEDPDRRRFLGAAVAMLAGHVGATRAGASPVARRHTPELAGTTAGTSGALGTPKQIAAGVLDVGYTDAGPPTGRPVVLLHGWPYDVHSFADVVPLLVAAGHRVIVPHLRGFGTTRFLSDDTIRNGQQAALALDVIALMGRSGSTRPPSRASIGAPGPLTSWRPSGRSDATAWSPSAAT